MMFSYCCVLELYLDFYNDSRQKGKCKMAIDDGDIHMLRPSTRSKEHAGLVAFLLQFYALSLLVIYLGDGLSYSARCELLWLV